MLIFCSKIQAESFIKIIKQYQQTIIIVDFFFKKGFSVNIQEESFEILAKKNIFFQKY